MARAPQADFSLDDLNVAELQELAVKVDALITQRQSEARSQLMAKMTALAAEAGLSLDDVLSTRKGKGASRSNGATRTVAVKYRNPDNADETWSGRGRMATWLVEKLKKRGAKIDDFAV